MCATPALFTSATVGPRELREVADLAQMVHAHLDHRVAVLVAQAQQRERHADVVVEIAGGGEHRVVARLPRAGSRPASPSPWSCRCCR